MLIMLDEPQADAGRPAASPPAASTAAPAAGRVIERIAPFLGVRRVILASDSSRKSAAGRRRGKLGADER